MSFNSRHSLLSNESGQFFTRKSFVGSNDHQRRTSAQSNSSDQNKLMTPQRNISLASILTSEMHIEEKES